jgi:hypothetical protein
VASKTSVLVWALVFTDKTVRHELRMTPQEVLNYLQAQPFRPFRIRMNSGRTFDIPHPDMVRSGRRDLLIFTFVSDSPDVYDRWENVSLLLIESISPLEASVA